MGERIQQRRSLSQVFLKSDGPVLRMVQRLSELGIERALEIGPGNGILTRALLDKGFAVTAVEKDERFAERLQDWAKGLSESPRFSVLCEDILKFDLDSWLAKERVRTAIVGNIPYNISSPILIRGLTLIRQTTAMMFMTQLEFAKRLVAKEDSKDYGSLSVFAHLRADVSLEFHVPRSSFQPVPKVDSAVVLLLPRRDPIPEAKLVKAEAVTRAAFTQRRKMLRNSVRAFLDQVGEEGCPIDLDRRADSLSPREFLTLAEFLVP